MSDIKEQNLAALRSLAEQLELDLGDNSIAVARANSAKAVMYDGSLEATMIPTSRGRVSVNSPRNPGVSIELVDHQRDMLAPLGAVYRIMAFMPEGEGCGFHLNGDVGSVYVGKEGIILDKPALRRAAELYERRKE